MVDHLRSLADESQRFTDAVADVDFGTRVPSCPDWSLGDLVWHLAEVQYFWASIVEGPLMEPELVPDLERPEDTLLRGLFNEQSARLHRALSAREPETPCWTWYEPDQTTGWVRRRQAHEALIHRIDAELCADDRTPVDPALAADGIDEILRIQIDGIPGWGTFTADGITVRLTETDQGTSWGLEFGRFTGTSPNTNTTYDLDAASVIELDAIHPQMELRGSAEALNLWLWGRATSDSLDISGDADLVDRLRVLAAASTN
ncbi:MAG: maleylpyruvate isomerase family mycothiol-dependent enzyme [Acidimicrobiia bacterium]|nr:maleylpyruvate isomerase family mycothiol-dependent enzyme [Acidimicrobiia bacterium]